MIFSIGALATQTIAVYNVAGNNYSRALIPMHYVNTTLVCLRNSFLFGNPSYRRLVPVAAEKHLDGIGGDFKEDKQKLVEQIRVGSLMEDKLSYTEMFVIRSYEVGINGTSTVETIANLLQEIMGNHFRSVGILASVFARHLILVAVRMHIELYRYPSWKDVVEIETWFQSEGRIGIRRDWIIRDYANGEVIGRATSKWILMDEDTRRPQKVSGEFRDKYLEFCPKTLRLAFPEENNNSLMKIGKLEDPAEYSRLGIVPRRTDMDFNRHVNNVTYIGWVLESIPQEVIDSHELQSITLDYKRECQHDDIIDSLSTPEPLDAAAISNNGSVTSNIDGENLNKFLHLLRSSGNGLEINRCRTEWRKKPVKRCA